MKVLALLLVLLPTLSSAGEKECLAAIMVSEASGESLEGLVAVAQASINRAKATRRAVCNIKGVTRKSPPADLAEYYRALAESILKGGKSIVGAADSWERSRIPKYAGKITRRIEHHTFYVSKRLN